MGILADVFVSSPTEALSYEASQATGTVGSEPVERAEVKGLLDLNFSILWAILEQRDWDLQTHELEEVAMGEGGETWLFRFPDGLVEHLARLEEPRIRQVTAQWAATEELDCSPVELEPVMEALVRLARSAKTSERGLCLWGSL